MPGNITQKQFSCSSRGDAAKQERQRNDRQGNEEKQLQIDFIPLPNIPLPIFLCS